MAKRVAIVTTSYPRTPGDSAGHFVESEAVALADGGACVHVIAPGPVGERMSGDLHVWGVGGTRLFGHPGAVARLRERPARLLDLAPFLGRARARLLSLEPLDHVFAHFIVPSAYPLGFATRAPLSVVAHGADVRLLVSLPARLSTHIVRTLLDRDAQFRFVGQRLRQALLDRLAEHDPALARRVYDRSRVEPMSFTVPASDTRERALVLRAALQEENDGRSIWVVCGRLVASKRVDRAIRLAHREHARLVIVGDGPERGALERLSRVLGAEVRFVGQLPRRDALSYVAAADRLVHLSDHEAAPTVVREARMLGIPVLAAPAGDVPLWAARDRGIDLYEGG